MKRTALFVAGMLAGALTVPAMLGVLAHASTTTTTTATGYPVPMVSLTFDDGSQGQYDNARPLLDQYGDRATYFIVTKRLNTSSNMTGVEVQQLATEGNEIGSHTVDHQDLTKLSSAQVDAELRDSQATLQTLIGGPVRSLATPYTTTNATVEADAAKYYASSRAGASGLITPANFHPYKLAVLSLVNTTTVAQMQTWIDQAVAAKAWLIFLIHKVKTYQPTETYAISTAMLDSTLSYLKKQAVSVVTQAQGLAIAENPAPVLAPEPTPSPAPTSTSPVCVPA